TYDGSGKAAGVKVYYNGRPQETLVEADRLAGSIRTDVPFKIGQRHSESPLSGGGVQGVRVYTRALTGAEVESLAKSSQFAGILSKPADQRSDAEKNEVYPWWLSTFDAKFRELEGRLAQLEREQADIKARGTVAHVMQEEDDAAMAFILFRGEYDERRDPVKPGTPEALPAFPEEFPQDRLGFARWLLLPENPLTARVTVNRFWQQVFGTGIVATPGDFGVMGELPSHPELLDWMAVEFMGNAERGMRNAESDSSTPHSALRTPHSNAWDVKALFRLIVTSATYRQAATITPEKLEKDPANRLLSRGPRFRMDAEMVRDYALAASGLLVRKLGGPSVKPYQPPGVWEAVAMIGSNTRNYEQDHGEKLYRRSLYTFWKRSAPPASLDILNAPSREICTVRRDRTNTPLQALVTLNDTQFVEAARFLAERTLKEGGETDEARLDFLARRLLIRPFREKELPIVKQSLAELRSYYGSHPDDAKKLIAVGESKADPNVDPVALASWTMLINELMNLDEVLNK
ncbi:MAG: DUF1553 domain-containing protein, partial [Planctomycetaceae bacterium]